MKFYLNTIFKIIVITSVVNLVACTKSETPIAASSKLEISIAQPNVIDWGPKTMTLGDNPNKQSDGSLGIWIRVSEGKGLGDIKVLFGGQETQATSVNENLITTAVVSEQISQLGSKEISLKQASTGKIYPVGTFIIEQPK